jgi:hypothetical protein
VRIDIESDVDKGGGGVMRDWIAVELVQTETTRWGDLGWTGQVVADALGEDGAGGEGVIGLGWYPQLAGLCEEVHQVVGALRAWWPELSVRVTLNGSASAARVAARREGVTLPR